MQANEVLRKALGVLYFGGWKKGSLGPDSDIEGEHCALGAIYAVPGASPWDKDAAIAKLQESVRDWTGFSSIPAFNDYSNTKFDDVEKVYKRAIGE